MFARFSVYCGARLERGSVYGCAWYSGTTSGAQSGVESGSQSMAQSGAKKAYVAQLVA